jgi:hypothetical protein
LTAYNCSAHEAHGMAAEVHSASCEFSVLDSSGRFLTQ